MATFKERLQAGYQQTKQQQAALDKDPSLAKTLQIKMNMRVTGVIIFILGLGLTLANLATYFWNDSILIIALAANIVFVVLGLYMMISGKNPFRKFRSF